MSDQPSGDQLAETHLPNPQDLRSIPAGREVVSFHIALDRAKSMLSLKTLTKDGRREVLLLAPKIALYLRDQFRDTLRARKGLEQMPTDADFFAKIPEHVEADWNTDNPHVGVPIGVHVETGNTGCILAFPMDNEGQYVPYGMSALHAAYYMHAVNDLEENEEFGKAPVVPTAQGPATLQ